MFREKYILDNELIKPDEQLLASLKVQMKLYTTTHESLHESMLEEVNTNKASHNFRSLAKYGSLAACFLILIISIATINTLNGSKKDTSAVADDTLIAETTTESSQDMEITEFSGNVAKDSSATNDSISKKTADSEEKSFSLEIAPSHSFIDGKINIILDNIDTIVMTDNTNTVASQRILTDKTEISELITCLNSLVLTPVTQSPTTDPSQERIITIQYNNVDQDAVIQLYKQYLIFNDSDWYELSKTEFEQLNLFFE